MSKSEFDEAYDRGDLDDAHMEYIMEHSAGERAIGNGDALIRAFEDGYLYDSFKESMTETL